jgi:alpha-1,3-rhamnosyl/mannosyltransferase
VLTSSTSALQEIAGGYAYLVDPMDVDAIARGIGDLATDPARRAELAELGKRRAAEFSWDRAAEQTLKVYAETLAIGRRTDARPAPPDA